MRLDRPAAPGITVKLLPAANSITMVIIYPKFLITDACSRFYFIKCHVGDFDSLVGRVTHLVRDSL